jgi:WD40 repeat protein/serine/threonine protein kinase/tetratricopeptide (TPR) repeat protein
MTEREIFIAALQKEDPAERQAYLDESCAQHPELRRQVEHLLRLHEGAGSFLEKPAAESAATEASPDAGNGAAVPEAPGMRIGPYKLIGLIGEGGMGTVWMAQQTEPVKRLVAIKLVKAGMDSRQVVARFEAERQALALMDHPNIARVLDGGTTSTGRPYFVMDLVKGVPITRHCDEHHLTPRQRLELFIPVCQAIQHAHQKGIIHRDLKPSNVLVAQYDGKPVPKVIDFGVAKAAGSTLTEKTLVTGFGAIVGTLEYMSPEQAEINQLDIDTRSDVYSLGVLLYELLTGTTPLYRKRLLETKLLEVLRQIREDDPPRPSTRLTSTEELPRIAASRGLEPGKLSGLLRGELDSIVMKSLEKDRSDRYETAGALAADVGRYLDDEPVQACPPSTWYRFRKFARRHKAGVLATASLSLGVLLALCGLAGALLVLVHSNARITQAKGRTEDALFREKRAGETVARARAAAVADAYRALLGETQALRLARPGGWREAVLEKLRRLALMDTQERNLAELRSEAVACLAQVDAREVLRLEGHTELVYGLDFSPDSKTLASAGYDGRLFLWDLTDGHLVRKVSDPGASGQRFWSSVAPLPAARFRPSGGYLAYTTWGQRVASVGCGEPPSALPDVHGSAPPRDLAFDRNGKVLAVSWGDGHVGLYDARTGALQRLVAVEPPGIGFYMPIALCPRGDLLATRGAGETVQLDAVGTDGAAGKPLGHHAGRIRSLAFSPDGTRLASASDDRTIKLWDVDRGQEVLTLQGHTSKVTSVAFAPDGEVIATGGDDQTLRLWDARTGQSLLVLYTSAGAPEVVAFSRNGAFLAAGFYKAAVVYRLAGRLERHLPGHGFWTPSLAFHPRRPVLASSSRDNDVTLWDVAAGVELQRVKGFAAPIGNLAFSPDGRLLAAAPFARLRMPYYMMSDAVFLLETESGRERQRIPGPYTAGIAFDASGRRLALGERDGAVSLFDIALGKVVHRWKAAPGWICDLAFLDEGSQLLVGEVGGCLRVWDVPGGHILHQVILPRGLPRFAVDRARRHVAAADSGGTVRILALPGLRVLGSLDRPVEPGSLAFAFSSDGRWLAVGGEDRRASIYDAQTFQKVLQLPPKSGALYDLAFQPGRPALAIGSMEELLTVWDLARVESALAGIGLGFGEAPPAQRSEKSQDPPLSLILGFRGSVERTRPVEVCFWFLEDVLRTNPDQPEVCMELAWIQVMGPAEFRDAPKALGLARRALELAPDQPLCQNTLGIVYYRLGRWQEAIEALRASARTNAEGPTAYDLFFLAMSYRHTGELEKAIECYDQAVKWCRGRADLPSYQVAELRAIRAEADEVATLLNIPGLGRGRYYADRGEWDKAAADYAAVFEWELPKDPFAWFEYAYLRIRVGDAEGYRALCDRMRQQFGQSSNVDDIALLAHTCVLAPGALGDAPLVLELARQRFDKTPAPSPHQPWSVHVLGLASYRAGRYQEAVDALNAGLKESPDWDYQILNWLVLSMAHERLGHCDRARTWLDKAEREITGKLRERSAESTLFAPRGWHWRDWLGVERLRREARDEQEPCE